MTITAGYDLVGDIHGHADALERLLKKLGYNEHEGVYQHAERKLVFLGDFIDRGPKIWRVIEIAKAMVESNAALAVMGNHEFNALAFHTSIDGREDSSLRPRSTKNIRQHAATLQQLKDHQLSDALDWFRSLPMWMEIEGAEGSRIRAVHACWDDEQIASIEQAIEQRSGFTSEFLKDATDSNHSLFKAVEIILKGKELALPEGYFYHDKEGHKRTAIRTRWFERPPAGSLYEAYALQADPIDCPIQIETHRIAETAAYPADHPPVFVGHYWLHANQPSRLASNIACLDYSIAKDGFLCSYRWDGEQQLDDAKFVWTQ